MLNKRDIIKKYHTKFAIFITIGIVIISTIWASTLDNTLGFLFIGLGFIFFGIRYEEKIIIEIDKEIAKEVKENMKIKKYKPTKIKITCPECNKSEIFEISSVKDAFWEHKCNKLHYIVNMRIEVVEIE